jgi:pseudoazurin|tara:strand:+ start:642 stop:1292 length:651 start_codon:yes stop_codon:yes gene_type:complete
MNDKQFMTFFLGVMGVLLIIFFSIFFIAQLVSPEKRTDDSFTVNSVVKRIAPIGQLNYTDSSSSDDTLESQALAPKRESICETAKGDFKTYVVKMLNQGTLGSMIFEPAFIKINTCDSINFEMSDAGHNAVTVAAPAGSVPFDTKYKPSTLIQFDTNGLYLYKCAPHAMMAMAGLIQVSDASNKAEMVKAIMKFEGTVMMPNVKTRMSDLLNSNVK